MSETTCNPCDDYSCACPVLECITTLLLGTISSVNTQVYIHITKANGAEYIQAATSDANGKVTLTLTDPDRAFYNHFDGTYIVYVMIGGYFCDGDKQTVTSVGGTWTTAGITFKKCDGVAYTTQNLQLTGE